MGNEQGNAKSPPSTPALPSNARLMNTAIKQRLAKGNAKSTYNMKVVISGDRQTGKSALFHRLEGGGFIKEHRTTAQIQCSHVLWPYKTSDEMVNLEIWDVVDKAILPTNIIEDNNGIVTPSVVSKNLLPADATTIDVYQGAHAVIFMVDPTRKWTFDYVKSNISNIPQGIDCVIIFGKKDLNKLWTLTNAEIEEFMLKQPKTVTSLEVSLQDCYGMKELHSFFNVPFLRMKAKYLQQELARAEREHEQSKVELDIMKNHQNYDEFLNRLKALKENKKNKNIKPNSPTAASAHSFKVKQTVTSSKDLPLIVELQNQKEEEKKKQQHLEQEEKQKQAKKQDNLETFKPLDTQTNSIDDFFADLGHANNNEDEDDDYKSEDEDEDDDDLSAFQIKAKPKLKAQMNGDNDNEIQLQMNSNGHKNIKNKKEEEEANNNNNEDPVMNGIINDKNEQQLQQTFNRIPDLKLTQNNSSGKRQGLMKVQSAEMPSDDSDDDEPLVFAAPKQIKTKPIVRVIKQKQKPKQKVKVKEKLHVQVNMDPIDLSNGNDNDNDNDNDKNDINNDKQQELNDFLDDLTGNKATKSVNDNGDGGNDKYLDEEAARKKKKEEKRRRRKEKKEKKKRKKEKKKKKKKKLKEKDSDLVEYDNDKDSDSEGIFEID